jgi:Rod binding domain-containing protein
MATSMIGPGAVTAQAGFEQARESQMLRTLNSGSAPNEDGKIAKGAQQFEAMLLTTWMQQAEQSMATVPGAEDDEDQAGREQMMSFGTQSLADAIAASGGLGIAKMISKAMHAQAEKAESASGVNPQPEADFEKKADSGLNCGQECADRGSALERSTP